MDTVVDSDWSVRERSYNVRRAPYVIWSNRFVENLLELAGKCIYRNRTPLCRDKVVQSSAGAEEEERKG